jgi:NAD(P)-dependent dehydrogenase (short-subunit alcohol dehydrogenase family)
MTRTYLVTGANGNLGVAVVKSMLEKGFRVIAVDSRKDMLEFAEANPLFTYHTVDLLNEKATHEFVLEMIWGHSHIDGALMLAGGFAMGDLQHTTMEDIQKMTALNFHTAFHIVQPLLESMKLRNFGRFIFVGARPSLDANAGKEMVAYAMSKSLLFRLSEMINEFGKKNNITATVVVPSVIDTPVNRKSMPNEDPSKWVKPEDIAEIMSFVCGERGDAMRESVIKMYNQS